LGAEGCDKSGSIVPHVVKSAFHPARWAALLVLVFAAPTLAQPPAPIQGTTTTVETVKVGSTLTELTRPVGAPHIGEALGLATELGIATTPFGAASGGFLIKLDPTTGLQVRTATTFGPSFAERALTSGDGQLSVGVAFTSATYTKLDTLSVGGMQTLSATGTSAATSRSGVSNLSIMSKTALLSARIGVSDKFDVGVSIPIVSVEVGGTSTLRNGNGDIVLFAQGSGKASGLGDVAGLAKYRFYSFGSGEPDPGGLAVMVTMRLPTGDRDNLRGLGVSRTFVSLIASSGQARFRPHANVGVGIWSKGVAIPSDSSANATVTARNEMQYAGGFEFEAAPKLTLLLDLLGGNVFGGGKVEFTTISPPASGFTAAQGLVAMPEGIQKIALAPGLKVNLKGKLLLSLNALVSLHDTGLHAPVIPVAGIDLNF
jgi:hypothetical protein